MPTNRNSKTVATLEKLAKTHLTLGDLLAAIRQGEELSQVEFARKLGISRQFLCDLEHHRRFLSPKVSVEFSKKLGYSPDQFVRLSLQDLLKRDGLEWDVELKAA